MENKKIKISLYLENDVASSMITMFSTLNRQKNNKEVIISDDCKSITIKTRGKDEIIAFNFDYQDLENKIFNWFSSGQSLLHLDEVESEIFRNCSYAAYYFLLEDEKMTSEQIERNHFVKFHELYLKKEK